MTTNRVRASIQSAFGAGEFDHVSIDDGAIEAVATDLADVELTVPDWRGPPHPDDRWSNETILDLYVLAALNEFQFIMADGSERYRATYDGETWEGGFAMWRSLTDALRQDIPITDGEYLRELSVEATDELFRGDAPGDTQIPMLEARHEVLTATGRRLCNGYDGHFHTLVETPTAVRLFDDGDGFVERLIEAFPEAFADSRTLDGETVAFDKKAQLAAAMLYGRFQDRSFFTVEDIEKLTIFADYVVPANLRAKGILEYDTELADRIETATELPVGSRYEIEVRAASIVAGDRLLATLEAQRGESLIVPQLDYHLWKLGRDLDVPYHVTYTTTY
ncbi:MAG: queuosine salvage family protein [Halobacteriales archaeon]